MITTLDNVKCKRGEIVWEIGVSIDDGKHKPTRSVVHGHTNRLVNEDRCWKDYELCKKECGKLNRSKLKTIKTK